MDYSQLTNKEPLALTAAQTRELERLVEESGTSLDTLMQRAGEQVAGFVCDWSQFPCPVTILCGSGNNGGDGWVAADMLAYIGYPTTVLTTIEPADIKSDLACNAALHAVEHNKSTGRLTVKVSPVQKDLEEARDKSAVIIDAILGTGFDGNTVRDPYGAWIKMFNNHRDAVEAMVDPNDEEFKASLQQFDAATENGRDAVDEDGEAIEIHGPARPLMVAVDMPSGLSTDEGTCAEPTFHADYTITMMTRKKGQRTDAGRKVSGHVMVAHIALIDKFTERFREDESQSE